MNTKIRTLIISLIAAGGFATFAVAAQAETPQSLEEKGYKCEVTHEPTEISCSNGVHLFSCSLTDCTQIYQVWPPVVVKVIKVMPTPVTGLKMAL
jgi:hypothetical protein